MPIVDADIQFRFSGGASNSDPNASLGGVMSSTVWTGGVLHGLFDVITAAENTASTVDWRCVYVRNGHTSLPWETVKAWLSDFVAGGADLTIGLDPAGAGDGSATGVAATIANETTAPAAVTVSAPTSKAAGLSVGTLTAGQAAAIWLRRTATNSAALSDDGATVSVEGDTGQ